MENSAIYGIFGAGGFGREVMPIACDMLAKQGISKEQIVFIDDGDMSDVVNGHLVLSREKFICFSAKYHYFNVAVGGSKVREEIANYFLSKKHCLFQ